MRYIKKYHALNEVHLLTLLLVIHLKYTLVCTRNVARFASNLFQIYFNTLMCNKIYKHPMRHMHSFVDKLKRPPQFTEEEIFLCVHLCIRKNGSRNNNVTIEETRKSPETIKETSLLPQTRQICGDGAQAACTDLRSSGPRPSIDQDFQRLRKVTKE